MKDISAVELNQAERCEQLPDLLNVHVLANHLQVEHTVYRRGLFTFALGHLVLLHQLQGLGAQGLKDLLQLGNIDHLWVPEEADQVLGAHKDDALLLCLEVFSERRQTADVEGSLGQVTLHVVGVGSVILH